MKQDIRFKGLQLSPDEQVVENGAMAVCDGMEMHNGALRPCVIEGNTVANVDGEILYIHEINATTTNVIFADTAGLLYFKPLSLEAEATELDATKDFTRSDINEITSNGNTMVVLTNKGLRYFRWKENTYKYLGEMPPMVELEFQLQTSPTMLHDIIGDDESKLILVKTTSSFSSTAFAFKIACNNFILYQEDTKKEIEALQIQRAAFLGLYYREEVDSGVDYDVADCLSTRESANDAAMGRAATAITKANQFYRPFYVRYCYRMWDGRKIMHSAPVLMFTDINYPETVVIYNTEVVDDGEHDDYTTKIDHRHSHAAMLLPSKLQYKCLDESVLQTLKTDWKDIVKSIDVYVTPGISRYDESYDTSFSTGNNSTGTSSYKWEAKWHRMTLGTDSQEKSILNWALPLTEDNNASSQLSKMSTGTKAAPILDGTVIDLLSKDIVFSQTPYFNKQDDIDSSTTKKSYGLFTPQPLSDADWKKRLVEQNAYYLLKRLDLKETDSLPTDMTDFPIDANTLTNLEGREQMIKTTSPDDYRTHNSVIAETSFVYNNRINLAGISEIPFEGFSLNSMLPIVSKTQLSDESASFADRMATASYIIVRLETDTETVFVKCNMQKSSDKSWITINGEKNSLWLMQNGFVFYPDTRAKEMWILTDDNKILANFDLEEHPLLNGAYHMGNMMVADSNDPTTTTFDSSILTTDTVLNSPSYVLTSASGNPFVFPAANRYSVGTGKVLAIAATTRALSQGQFGQFPLIAFTSDGIWALELSSTGSYAAVQPISREVITNTKGLLHLDQSIAFVTKRALNQIMGSDVQSISDALQGPLRDLSAMLKNLPATNEDDDPINSLQAAEAIYDYADKRLLYFLKEDDAFTGDVMILCASDNAWAFKSLGSGQVKGIYNSCPYPYIHFADGRLDQLADPYDNQDKGSYSGIVVSRTIKSDGFRSVINGFIQDYDIDLTKDPDNRPVLYFWGSNDNRNWYYIGKSNARHMDYLPGKIYKYFRVAVQFTGMKRNDLYHGLQLDIQERFTR